MSDYPFDRPAGRSAQLLLPPAERSLAEFSWPLIAGGPLIAYGAAKRNKTGLALAVLGSGLVYRQFRDARPAESAPPWVRVERSVTIDAPPRDLFRFWMDLENLPRVMSHLISVTRLDDRRTRWIAKAPANREAEWVAEMTDVEPNRCLAWHSVAGDIQNSGSVHFSPATGGRGTVVKVSLQYAPPHGRMGTLLAKLTGEEPSLQLGEDLKRLKQLVETGEISTVDGQPACRD